MLQRLFILTLLFVPSVAFGQTYWGDYQDSNQTEYMYFPTSDDTGAKVTLTSGTLACIENGGSQFTTGLTLDNDYNTGSGSVTGFHQIAVDFSDANFEAGKTYTIILTAGTVDGVSVVGSPVVTFSIGRYAIAPDGFDGLDIDGSGAVIIQDGTDPGQIATTSGAIDTVTTVTQLTAATTEPTSVPSATAGFIDKVNWLFLIARNKRTVTDALIQYFADDGSTVIGEKDLTDDDTTFTEAEATDP